MWPDKPIEITGDEGLIGEALANLLGNAWKFTGKTEHTKVEFGESEGTGAKTYYIRDNGSGFRMEFAGNLFRPFQRLHSQSQFPGSGIGLSIVQRIIEKHGGKVWADSTEGAGTTFYFTLPPPAAQRIKRGLGPPET